MSQAFDQEQGFSWAQWTPNTKIMLCNVPWDSSYRDLVRFDSEQDRDSWFQSLDGTRTVSHAVMAKFGAPVRLEIPFNQASKYNYMVVYNDYPSLEVPRRWFYFVQSVSYINAYTTEFVVMLDLWTSFQFDVHFGRCFIERGHIGIANENAMKDNGRANLDIPEGLDTGSDGVIVNDSCTTWMSNASQHTAGVLVVSTTALEDNPGTDAAPVVHTAKGVDGPLPNGTSSYYFPSPAEFGRFMSFASQYPLVTQGIVAVFIIPHIWSTLSGRVNPFDNASAGVEMYRMYGNLIDSQEFMKQDNFRDLFMKSLDGRYAKLSKFSTYPYAYIELTMQTGSSLIIKPQFVYDNDLKIQQSSIYAAPQPRATFRPLNYMGKETSSYAGAEQFNAAIGFVDFPRLAVVNNGTIAYLQSTAYSRAYARESADWSQSKTQMGINNALALNNIGMNYNTSSNNLAMGNRNAMTNIANSATITQTGIDQNQMAFNNRMAQINAVGTGVTSLAGAVAADNPAAAVGAIVGTGMQVYSNQQAYDQNVRSSNATMANNLNTSGATNSQANTYSRSATNLQNSTSQATADTNAAYATAAMQGDYANTIAGINAQVQSANTVQPSMSGSAGGESLMYSTNKLMVHLRFKRLSDSAMRNIGEFWLRYGYYVQRFIVPPENLRCMSKFSYWKMHETYLSSTTCPEEYRMAIRGIFEKGVTVWAKPEYIGMTDYADNDKIAGISY